MNYEDISFFNVEIRRCVCAAGKTIKNSNLRLCGGVCVVNYLRMSLIAAALYPSFAPPNSIQRAPQSHKYAEFEMKPYDGRIFRYRCGSIAPLSYLRRAWLKNVR